MLDIQAIIIKTFEYAPAVAILLYINWRNEKTLRTIITFLLRELSDVAKKNQ
jgi:hypothetical protein